MAVALNLPILEKAVDAYNTAFKRELRWERLEHLRLTDSGFFDRLNLDWGGLEGVKSELALGNVEGGKLAYEAFMRRRANDSELYRAHGGVRCLGRITICFNHLRLCQITLRTCALLINPNGAVCFYYR